MVRSSYVRKLRFNDIGFWFVIVRYFVLLNIYGLQKKLISNKVRYTSYFHTFCLPTEITSQLRCILVCQFTVSFPTSELCYKCFSYNDIFFMTLGLRSFVVCCITCGNNVWNNIWKLRFVFVRHCDIFFYFVTITIFICSQ